jgi:hypothetical protein
MRAISSVNLLKNDIGVAQAEDLVSILKDHSTLRSLCGNKGNETALDLSGKMNRAADAIMLVAEIIDNRAMTALDISANSIVAEDYIKAPRKGIKIGELVDGNPVVEEEKDDDGEIKILQLNGIRAIASAIPNMGALSIANVMGNSIGKEMLSKLQEIMRSKPNLVSLCGIADDASEADLSGLRMDADDAIILASELPDKGALSVLNLAYNNLGELVLQQGWTQVVNKETNRYEFEHIDGRTVPWEQNPGKPEGIVALANAIRDMRALSHFDISKNSLNAEGGRLLAEALKGNQVITKLNHRQQQLRL